MPRQSKFLLGLSSVMVIIAVSLGIDGLVRHHTDAPIISKTVLMPSGAHITGVGQVVLVEFGDYQCSPCGTAETWVRQARREMAGQVTFVFRNFPISQVHPNTMAAAEAAEAASAQGHFWPMHDKLYAEQANWSGLSDPTAAFVSYAGAIGVPDLDKFKSDLASHAYAATIQADFNTGRTIGVDATPTFYLNGRKIQPTSYANLRKDLVAAAKK